MFEQHRQPLLSRRRFMLRTLRYSLFSGGIISLSLFLGMAGYRLFAGIGWIESFYNAAMILTGMGPALDINALPPDRQSGSQIFAGLYALYSGVVFLVASGLILSPIVHRFLHIIHLDEK